MRYRVSAYPTPQNKNHHHALDSAFLAEKTRRRAKQSTGYLLDTSKILPQTGLAVLLCQVVLGYPVPDGPKPPPRTQFCVSRRENLQTGQTEHWLPSDAFKNNGQKCCGCLVLRYRVSTYPIPRGSKTTKSASLPYTSRESVFTTIDWENRAY